MMDRIWRPTDSKNGLLADNDQNVFQNTGYQPQYPSPYQSPSQSDAAYDGGVHITQRQAALVAWPNHPRRLRSNISGPAELSLNFISALIVGLLSIYIIFLLVFDGAPTNTVPTPTSFLRQISQLGPTILPIAFAFIVGRAIRSYAHWRLQEGERIGRLDFLYGSTTVTNTMSTMIDLRRFGPLELFLALVWTLSPLGGQAILRVLTLQTARVTNPTTLQYVNLTNSSWPDVFLSASWGGAGLPVASLFLSSLGAPAATRNSSMDTWGNLMVPMIELLPGYKGSSSADWINLKESTQTPAYSAVMGVPVGNVAKTMNSTFNIETSYWSIQCTGIKQIDGTDGMNDTRTMMNGTKNDSCGTGCARTFMWGTLAQLPSQYEKTGAARCQKQDEPWSFMYLSWDADGDGTFANCTMTTSYVEMIAACNGWNCTTEAIRPSQRPNRGPYVTMFNDCLGSSVPNFWSYYIGVMGTVGATIERGSRSGTPSLLQVYLADPSQALNASSIYTIPGLWTVDSTAFSTRMSQIFNSFWTATVATEAVYLGHPENYDALSLTSPGISFAEAPTTTISAVEIIRCNRGWLAPLILSTAAMLLSVLASLWTDVRIWVPRILMNMSTMTRGNPYFGVPEGGSVLPDEARSRHMRNVRVRFGDIDPGSRLRSLAIGDCAEEGGRVEKIRRDCLYI